jgi:thiamine pyrophosphokinase
VPEQETTDFDKCLRSIAAPLILAVGFHGARLDHGLAALNALVRHGDRKAVLIGPSDLAFHLTTEVRLRLRAGDRVSLFPLAQLQCDSEGLVWPTQGLNFAPDGRVGTSNAASGGTVSLRPSGPGLLVILPRNRLDAAIAGLAGQ